MVPHSLMFSLASGFSNKWAFLQLIPSHLCKNGRIVDCELDWSEVLCRVPGPGSCSGESPPCGNLLLLTDSHLRVCCSMQVTVFCQVLWLPATVFVAACRLWAGRSLLVSSRSVDPTGMCARQIILALELALRQPGSCGWLVSLARRQSRGSPVALVEWKLESAVLQGAWAQAPTPWPIWLSDSTEQRMCRSCDEGRRRCFGESVQRKALIETWPWSHTAPHVLTWQPTTRYSTACN